MSASRDAAVARLFADGILHRVGDSHRTTRRWQGAMMRAALRLYEAGDEGSDLRVPIVSALVELYGEQTETALLVEMVAVLAPLERLPRSAVLEQV